MTMTTAATTATTAMISGATNITDPHHFANKSESRSWERP